MTPEQERRRWWRGVVVGVYVLAAPSLAIGVSAYNQRQSEKAWCEIISTLDDAYRVTPPTTPVGIRLAAAMHDLRSRYHC